MDAVSHSITLPMLLDTLATALRLDVGIWLRSLPRHLLLLVFGGIFRCYAVAIAAFVVLAETEWSFIIKFWRVFEYWAGRGMLQIFVAVMTRAFPDENEHRQDLVLLQVIASYLLATCGLTYVISGVLCIGFLKRARQHKEITREQAAKDLEELERRREELEALLIQERV